MLLLYRFGIFMYGLLVRMMCFFSPKARLFVHGRKQWVQRLDALNPDRKSHIWFHFASLGEFEQGKPVIIALKEKQPDVRIAISFFSPSGYEIRKNTPLANFVCYLPLDTPSNAKKFIKIIRPSKVFFTKYEFWHFFIKEIHKNQIPLYLISSIFRKNQIFFKWYGVFFRKILHRFTHFFLQNEESKKLLTSIQLNNSTVCGDTRFDTVFQNTLHRKNIPFATAFKNSNICLVAGSTWLPDENILHKFLLQHPEVKCILAPHEIERTKLHALKQNFSDLATLFHSEITAKTDLSCYQVLIIDQIGMLSQLYQFADISYVGGGFGAGIHNTLEAIAFGAPVIFGPKYEKFEEAKQLIQLNIGQSIMQPTEFKIAYQFYFDNLAQYKTAAQEFISQNKGATIQITNMSF